MAVLLVGKQCCVSKSAMARYDAVFWRNSVMTSFAGSRSWNFSGRRGVNSSTALRTVAGSNEDIEGNDSDTNLETRWRPNGNENAPAWTICYQTRFAENPGP